MADATYTLSIWDTPPSHVCLLCNTFRHATLVALTTHLADAHNTTPIPHPTIPALEALRAAADAREGA